MSSGADQQGQGDTQGEQPQQPAAQQTPEVSQQQPTSPAPSDQPIWVAPDYGISWATKSALPPADDEKRG